MNEKLDVKMAAGGRKGEEAIDVDITGILVGDWLTVLVDEGSIRVTRMESGQYRIAAGTSYFEAADGEAYGTIGVAGGNIANVLFHRKREPAADLAKAERGEFTS